MAAHAENSDVLPDGSVAVAVITSDDGSAMVVKVRAALPAASVAALAEPRNSCPSPLPVGSHPMLEKNSTWKIVLGVLLRVAAMLVATPELTAETTTGKFCELLGPESESPASFGVTPSPPRSMPGPLFEW